MAIDFTNTLENPEWWDKHEASMFNLLPDTWTHIQNVATSFASLPYRYQLKLIGLDWRSDEDIARILATLDKMGVLLRHPTQMCVKRNHLFTARK